MKNRDKILKLINHGFDNKLVSSLNESQINALFKRLIESKKETKEQSTQQAGVVTTITSEKKNVIDPSALTTPQGVTLDGMNLKNVGGRIVATQMKEENDIEDDDVSLALGAEGNEDMALALSNMELSEKFASKAQQKYFWAKCGRSTGKEKKKWCDMAKEFSKSTSKKQFEKMPEKIHPEETVKYKKESKEGYMDMVGKAMNKNMQNKISDIRPSLELGENDIEKGIMKLLEKHLSPKMSKKDFVSLVSETKHKGKKMNKKENKESESPVKTPVKPATPTKPSKPIPSTPYKPKHKPAPKAEKEFNESEAPVKTPVKPATPTKPSKPIPSTPYKPKHKPAPKAGDGELPNWLSFKTLGINLK